MWGDYIHIPQDNLCPFPWPLDLANTNVGVDANFLQFSSVDHYRLVLVYSLRQSLFVKKKYISEDCSVTCVQSIKSQRVFNLLKVCAYLCGQYTLNNRKKQRLPLPHYFLFLWISFFFFISLHFPFLFSNTIKNSTSRSSVSGGDQHVLELNAIPIQAMQLERMHCIINVFSLQNVVCLNPLVWKRPLFAPIKNKVIKMGITKGLTY